MEYTERNALVLTEKDYLCRKQSTKVKVEELTFPWLTLWC